MSKDNLVAKYMGVDGGDFHKSWDSLIPVINKLSVERDISMEIRHGEHPFCLSRGVSKEYKRSWEIIVCEEMTGIETAYKTVLETIKFLNRPKS